jgi:hypothetical protein
MDRSEEGPRSSRAALLDIVAILVIPGALTAAIYLAPFVNDPTRMPFGNDTPGYVWRTNVVHDLGVDALTREATSNAKAHGERPGYPVVLSIVRSLTASDSLTLAWITPALFASAIAIAFGSFVAATLREPGRLTGAVGLAVAGSAFVAWTAVGYATNLAIDAVAVAAAAVVARSAFGSRGRAAILVLIVGGALIHWAFALAIAILLASWALLLCAWRELERRRRGPEEVPGARRAAWVLLGTIVVAVALGAIALFVIAPELPQRPPRTPGQAQARIDERLPDLALPISFPLAVVGFGIVAVTEPKTPLRRWGAGFLLIWASLAVAGLIAWHSPSLPAPPPYRTAGFALGIPALVVLGPLAIRGWLGRRIGVAGVALGVVAAVAATVWLTATGARVWSEQPVHFTAAERGELDTLSSYLEGVPQGVRIVVPARPTVGAVPKFRVIAGIPPERAPFVRMPRRFIEPEAKNLGLHLGPLDPRTTVVVALRAFLPQVPSIGRLIGPGVWLIVGPEPGAVEPGVPARAPNGAALVILWVAGLGVLIVAGAGWSRGLTDLSVLGALGLAPAFGLSALGLIGSIAGRLGVPLNGGGAIAVLIVTAALGWGTVRVPRRYRARHA